MTCDCCDTARKHPGFRQGVPNCLHCGARLIQHIQRMHIPADKKRDRCRAVLADWVAWGHDEAEIRALAKRGSLAIS